MRCEIIVSKTIPVVIFHQEIATKMKKLMSIMLGLTLLVGAATVSFGATNEKKEEKKKKKKKKDNSR